MAVTPKSLSLIESQSAALTKLSGSFLKDFELKRLLTTCKQFKEQLTNPLIDRKKAKELLGHVLKADPKMAKEVLLQHKDKSESGSIVLIRVKQGKEEYVQKSKEIMHPGNFWYSYIPQEIICKRKWTNISSLEAAALSGDNFLVKDLLEFVPENQYKEALRQLIGVRDRDENAENGKYLSAFSALRNAYKDYIDLNNTNDLTVAENWNKWGRKGDELWEKLGEAQKKLPTFALQVYCDPKTPFHPIPDFTREPVRSCQMYGVCQSGELDLSSIGFGAGGYGTGYALYRAWGSGGVGMSGKTKNEFPCERTHMWCAPIDSLAIDKLYEVISSGLNQIINSLSITRLIPSTFQTGFGSGRAVASSATYQSLSLGGVGSSVVQRNDEDRDITMASGAQEQKVAKELEDSDLTPGSSGAGASSFSPPVVAPVVFSTRKRNADTAELDSIDTTSAKRARVEKTPAAVTDKGAKPGAAFKAL